MSNELYEKLCEFLVSSPLKQISVVPVVYKAMKEDPWASQDILKDSIEQAVETTAKKFSNNSQQYKRLIKIPQQFDIAYEGVCGLCDMGVIKTKKEKKLSPEQIKNNLSELKSKLSSSSLLHKELYQNLKKESYHNLKWKDYLANKIISDDSEAVKKLTDNYGIFMEPKYQMLPPTLPFIQGMCDRFVSRFTEPQEYYPAILTHDKTWKESNDILSGIAEEVLKVLGESWKNPAFSPELRSSQNEGTYVTHVIAPLIRAVLKDLPFGKSSYISMAEKKSVASSERKGGHSGKKPDMMFVLNQEEVLYELVYAEFSRLVCTKEKKEKDDIKLWRETNDGMDWVRNKCKPAKGKFGIIGIQVAGNVLKLNVLIRDEADVHRYYHLKSVEIPVQPTNEVVVAEFIHTLLIFRNLIIVNMCYIFHALPKRKSCGSEKSSNVSTPPP